VGQTYFVNFASEEGMNQVKIIEKLSRYYCRALQRAELHSWIKEAKLGRRDLPNMEQAPADGLYYENAHRES
jgi:hypothetical protein